MTTQPEAPILADKLADAACLMKASETELRRLSAANADLTAQLEQYKADAERYRWLRADPQFLGWDSDMTTTQIDEAIDAVMKGQP